MTFAFDLISDLHVETWNSFDWTGQATSPVCVVVGDIAKNLDSTIMVLKHLASCYQAVFYIDGNDEHRYQLHDLNLSYRELSVKLAGIQNLVYMRDTIVVINGVAILGANGWWSYDFDPRIDIDQTQAWCRDYYNICLLYTSDAADE